MARIGTRMFCFGGLALALCGGYVEQLNFDMTRQTTMTRVDPNLVALAPAPIQGGWIIEGEPKTMAAEIAHTDDGSTKVYVWQTSAATFHWNYESDEIVQITDGDVFIADGNGPARHLGPGDVAFFPAGAKTIWRVPDHLRKIATLKRPLPGPLASPLRWAREAKAMLKPEVAFAAD